MTTAQLAKYIGIELTTTDPRTGCLYRLTIADAKVEYGDLRVQAYGSAIWFQPTAAEMNQLGEAISA